MNKRAGPGRRLLAEAGYHSGSNLRSAPEEASRTRSADGAGEPYHKDRFVYDEASDSYRCPRVHAALGRVIGRRQVRVYRSSAAVCRACPALGVCTTNERHGRALEISPHDAALRRHRAWMSTAEAKQAFRQRKLLIEPVFGIIKEQQQAQRFLLRGLPNVAAEWTLLATAFNLRTLWRAWRDTATRKTRWAAATGAYTTYRAVKIAVAVTLLRLRRLGPQPA